MLHWYAPSTRRYSILDTRQPFLSYVQKLVVRITDEACIDKGPGFRTFHPFFFEEKRRNDQLGTTERPRTCEILILSALLGSRCCTVRYPATAPPPTSPTEYGKPCTLDMYPLCVSCTDTGRLGNSPRFPVYRARDPGATRVMGQVLAARGASW